MAITLGTTAQGNAAEGVRTTLNTGGTFVIYDGTPPANAQAALSGNNVLATHTPAAARHKLRQWRLQCQPASV